ncbi:MAG: glycosyltransferase family 4 protein [Sedimentisphaerales bacterium]|nr:glycosyltransferase family 4 protein [Sedimentisphaerales bacterium]
MKIVHIITRLILGGAQENTLITCRLLAERGHDVTLLTGPAIGPEGELFAKTKDAPYKVIVVDDMIRAISPLKDWSAYRQVKKILKEIQPDVVHTHSAKAGILGRYAAYSSKQKWRGKPHPTKKRATSDERRVPKVVHTIHGLAFHQYQNGLLNKFYIAIEKAAAKKTDHFICVADAMTRQALDAGIGKPEQFTTAYSAIEEEAFLESIPDEKITEFRVHSGISKDAVVLVTVARLFELKGHDYIIESAKQLSKRYDNVIWLFVGDGNLSDYYKKLVTDLGLAHCIKFTGLLPPDEIPLAMQAADILVHCSLREGLARAIPQGLLCGKPAIAFDLDGSAEVVNDNTGRLIEARNVEQLIKASAELIENKELRERLGRQGRESVEQKFAPDTMVDTIEAVYGKLTAE